MILNLLITLGLVSLSISCDMKTFGGILTMLSVGVTKEDQVIRILFCLVATCIIRVILSIIYWNPFMLCVSIIATIIYSWVYLKKL